jgi:hypothetical protein
MGSATVLTHVMLALLCLTPSCLQDKAGLQDSGPHFRAVLENLNLLQLVSLCAIALC